MQDEQRLNAPAWGEPGWKAPGFSRAQAADPSDVARDCGIDPLSYLPDMDVLDSPVISEVLERASAFDFASVTAADVRRALATERLSPEDFGALLSPAAEPFLEEMAAAAQRVRRRWFGSTAYLFTPLYLANYCDNHCVYCGFNRKNDICRAQLDQRGIVRELDAIAETGLEDVLLLTGEDRERTDPAYIAEACRLASERFRTVGVEVYPLNEDEYALLHRSGADYVIVFQETYDPALYGKLHRAGRKRVFRTARTPRSARCARACRRGFRASGIGRCAARRSRAGCTIGFCNAYPAAEALAFLSRLRPIRATSLGSRGVGERRLCRSCARTACSCPRRHHHIVARAWGFRDRVMGIAATKISAGVSTGVGEHAAAEDRHAASAGDDQFEIADDRDVKTVSAALRARTAQSRSRNDYVRV